ncbi:hypothetical protein C8P63_10638 [Melghirimyces profundicolus]|uniref:Uncharacterized protein n=1 Tax=Melghirimyces profundicolus TaxID=1242148 RepID=A0A2T6C0E1_9BACL|nr:hypothetical protein [Melghirimyces profundicolus]PTX61786.1 hypothetical protein C8P63_10638 [Melghirimyces profundicolus]
MAISGLFFLTARSLGSPVRVMMFDRTGNIIRDHLRGSLFLHHV